MNRLKACLLILCSCALTACDDLVGVACTDELRPNLIVEVRDAQTGHAAARGAIGSAQHLDSDVTTELYSARNDSLQLTGDWSRERAGRYVVVVRKPGFRTETVQVTVDEDRCHVRTERVPVTLTPDASAAAVVPLAFTRGERVSGSSASAGITTFGDTLVVTGRAAALCSDLDIVAFRSGRSWHIQLQPMQWEGTCPGLAGMQQFEARFRLPEGNNTLLITHGYQRPPTLFSGMVYSPGPVLQGDRVAPRI